MLLITVQVLLNILADEIHRAHQQCVNETGCDPDLKITDLVFEAGINSMKLLKGGLLMPGRSSRGSASWLSGTRSASGKLSRACNLRTQVDTPSLHPTPHM